MNESFLRWIGCRCVLLSFISMSIFFKSDEIVEPATICIVHAVRVCFQDGGG